ncbi:hypothetical protein BCR39DRAFT_520457 [Naematelia encephala]|uniref:t-SNARE coiled-coil homology domain-containing protein n=1 Tax=Naematelia encephala TaxID=71784 RepID=A0A1Y2BF82_9TREE|nr:hypothetical protein BCR39DRAFT_520457 [Naematelia encephala]
MSESQLTSLRQRLTSTSSLLLERSRVLSLGLPPSASSQNQITRNLSTIRSELANLSEVVELESSGLVVGSGLSSSLKRKGKEGALAAEVREMEEGYDRLIGMLEEDEVGREKAKTLRREEVKRKSSPSPSTTSQPPRIDTTPALAPTQTPPNVPSFNVEPPTPAVERPFRDDPDLEHDDEDDDGATPHEMLSQQQSLMDDQDERLNLLSHSINRQNTLSIQIGSELDIHNELLEDTDAQMDRTAARLGSARRRLDKVAHDAKQYGSTITIVVLIFILLVLIIVFKT